MITTAAFRIPPHLFGEACVYPLPAEFGQELDAIGHRWRPGETGHHRVPHASLAAALRAVTGQPVRIMPLSQQTGDDAFLITSGPIDPVLLARAVRHWERFARREGDPSSAETNALAPLMKGIAPEWRPIADAVDYSRPGRVTAERWVYDVLKWSLATRLAAAPVPFDHTPVRLQIDTEGTLVAWERPICRSTRSGTARALLKITPEVETLPGIGDLVCVIDASITRLETGTYGVKYVWIDPGREADDRLLRLPVGRRRTHGEWEPILNDFTASTVKMCELNPLPWSMKPLTDYPDQVRGGQYRNDRHPIGTGVGARTMLRLTEHAEALLGVEPVRYQRTSVRVLGDSKINGRRLTPSALDTAVQNGGYRSLRIVHLSATPATRERVRVELEHYRVPEAAPISPAIGQPQRLGDRVELVAYDVPDLLNHTQQDRSLLADQAPLLKPDAETLVLAIVDTEYAHGQTIPEDAKPHLRKALADLGVPSQFLSLPPDVETEDWGNSDQPVPEPQSSTASAHTGADTARDYPAEAALRDLLMRCGGLIDDRLASAVGLNHEPLERDAWLVGIHLRRQNSQRAQKGQRPQRPKLVSTMVAIRAQPVAGAAWSIWLHRPDTGWRRHPEGLTAFHSAGIGREIPEGQDQQIFADLRARVDAALNEVRQLEDLPIIVMADADATRRAWNGLADKELREGRLPGDSLPGSHDIAVVRINAHDSGGGALPRPVNRSDGQLPSDRKKPATPGNRAYELTGDDGTRSWLLGKSSRTHDANAIGRVGTDYTRFTLPEGEEYKHSKPWHAFTATEFTVARPGPFTEDTLLALAARLCAQPISWDGRTVWPVPLHLARIADRDHPGHRDANQTATDAGEA